MGSLGFRDLLDRFIAAEAQLDFTSCDSQTLQPTRRRPKKLNFRRPAGKRKALSSQGKQGFQTVEDGGAKEARTPDLLNAIQTLYQLSYDPINETVR